MCYVRLLKNLCKNEWCPNWASRSLVYPETWVPCSDPQNYSPACPNFRPEIDWRNERSTSFYCVACQMLGYQNPKN